MIHDIFSLITGINIADLSAMNTLELIITPSQISHMHPFVTRTGFGLVNISPTITMRAITTKVNEPMSILRSVFVFQRKSIAIDFQVPASMTATNITPSVVLWHFFGFWIIQKGIWVC
jgi:hypothetical protein